MRVKSFLNLPEIPASANGVRSFLTTLKKLLIEKDKQISKAINNLDIEIVASQPSAAPEYPAPVLRLFKNASTWQLWVYTGADGWTHVDLT